MNKKRKQIVDAALKLFIDQGFSSTSIQDILDRAGIAKGTFYNYFNSKNECLMAILDYIKEQVDQKRRELAAGKESEDEEVFIDQMTVRMNISRQHRLLAVFESVSFSDDAELKAYMKEQHLEELRWISARLSDIYPANADRFTFEHAVMLSGLIHHLMHVWKLGSSQDVDVKKLVRYALDRTKSMLPEQIERGDLILPSDWLGPSPETDLNDVLQEALTEIEDLKAKTAGKTKDFLEFLYNELQTEQPRHFLMESVLASMEAASENSEWADDIRSLVVKVWKLIS
ncbi:TetR/AcrR family transcriptional regulator [Halobacillus massiliensis]|uniref:TetR/AcrR family transcriptional regulator n=1 Tax=Halobacillus massiliensis TaxID=1926286 RepID=UPI0009E4E910|nr:TetR/AcrR family transcriptional regulator [Halobacillus massiliensis]